jgi:acetyl esterase/lipase
MKKGASYIGFILLVFTIVYGSGLKAQKKEIKIYETGIKNDVDYLGSNAAERMDIYFPSNAEKKEKFPGIIIIHGGGWVGGDKAAKREKEIGGFFSAHGYVCASINYTLADKNPAFPLNIKQCKSAVKYLRVNAKELQIDPEHIGVIGGSAGGHLALMVAYTADDKYFEPAGFSPSLSDRVQAVVDMYGPADLLTREKTDSTGQPTVAANVDPRIKYIGFTREERSDLWKNASPVYYITRDDPPTLILHGLDDKLVSFHQSTELDSLLSKAGQIHNMILLQNTGHTFTLKNHSNGKPLEKDLSPVVLEFFDKWLKK